MNKKNVDYILSSTDGIELLANLFQNGMALDLVDVTRARDNIDLPEDERHIYDMADAVRRGYLHMLLHYGRCRS